MKKWIDRCSRKRIISILCALGVMLAIIPFSSLVHAEPAPEILDSNLEQITFSDFNIDNGTYVFNNNDVSKAGEYKDPETGKVGNLSGKVISGDVTFSTYRTYLYVGGLKDAWYGLSIASRLGGERRDVLTLQIAGQTYTLTPEVAGTTLIDASFNLKLSFQEIDKDDDGSNDTLKLGVWFNNRLYNNTYIEVSTYEPTSSKQQTGNYTDYLTGRMYIVADSKSATMTVASDVESELDPTLEKLTFENFGIDDGTYTYNNGDASAVGQYNDPETGKLGSLSGKVISGDITFSSKIAKVYVGGWKQAWYGLSLGSGQHDSRSDVLTLKVAGGTYILTPEVAGTTLVGESVNLKLSFEEIDKNNDGTNDALQFGVWFNDKLYNNEFIEITTYTPSKTTQETGNYSDYLNGRMLLVPEAKKATIDVVSDREKILDPSLEKLTFVDFGIDDGEYRYNGGEVAKAGIYRDAVTKDVGSLSGKVIVADVTFSSLSTSLYIGGKYDAWYGLSLASGQNDADTDALTLKVGGKTYTFTPEGAKTTLVGASVNLKLSYQELDKDEDGTNDTLQLGVWFNDKLYNNKYIEVATYTPQYQNNQDGSYTDYLPGRIYIVPNAENATFSVVSDVEKTLDPSLEKLTLLDFNIKDGTYVYNGGDVSKSGQCKDSTTNELVNLSGKVISTDYTFSELPATLYVGGLKDAWYGLSLASGKNAEDTDALTLKVAGKEYTLTPEVAGYTLVGAPVNIKLSYQEVDKDNDGTNDALKIGVWFNDKLYNNKYIEVTTYEPTSSKQQTGNYTDYLTARIYLVAENKKSTLTVVSDVDKILDKGLEKITFTDFGIADGTYGFNGGEVSAAGTYKGTLSGKVIRGDVIFSEKSTFLYVGGYPDAWYGLSLASGQNDKDADALTLKVAGQEYTLTPEVAKATLVGESVNLKLSYQELDKNEDGQNDALQIGVWFNDKLYNNKYIYVTTYEHSSEQIGTRDYTDYLAGSVYIVAIEKDSTFTVVSYKEKILDSTLENITLRDFRIEDGTYEYNNGDIAKTGKYDGTLSGKVLSGDFTFSASTAYLYIGGYPDSWYGLSLATRQNDKDLDALTLKIGNQEYTLTPEIAEATLVGESVNIKLSYQELDTNADGKNDTLQLGVWFNNKLYNNQYIYVTTYEHPKTKYGTRDYTDYLAGSIYIYPYSKSAFITVASDIEFIPEVLDPSLKEISFGDFGFFDGTLDKVDHMELGKYNSTLDGKVFSGYVTFGEKRNDIWIGGQKDVWKGIGLMAGVFKKNIEFRYDGKTEYLKPSIAGTDLIGKEINLKISYQLVPKEGDETQKILQLGIWFNDKLYDNKYFYIENYERYLGGLLGIYTAKEGSSITIRSTEGLALKYAPGSKIAEVPYVGDETNYMMYFVLMCVAIAGIAFSSSRRKRGCS